MITTAIKRRTGDIGDLISGYAPVIVDESSKVKVDGDNQLTKALELYERVLNDERIAKDDDQDYLDRLLRGNNKSILIPELTSKEINQFIAFLSIYEEKRGYYRLTYKFLSVLINNSKDQEIAIDQIPDNITFFCGSLDKAKKITINSDIYGLVGFGNASKCINFIINGNVNGSLGHGGKYLQFEIFGETKKDSFVSFTSEADNSRYVYHKPVHFYIDEDSSNHRVNGTTFIFYDDIHGHVPRGENCSYKTNNKKTLKKLMERIVSRYYSNYFEYCIGQEIIGELRRDVSSSNNKIYFINPDGSEKLVWYVDERGEVVRNK